MPNRCAVCLGEGRIHLLRCRASFDEEVTCNCGTRVCPACNGVNSKSLGIQRARDYVRLLDRANELLRYPLSNDDRGYVQDLLTRLGSGNQPMLPDWFRSQELVDQYINKWVRPSARRKAPSVVEVDASKKKPKPD
jgi:hypothetical protein